MGVEYPRNQIPFTLDITYKLSIINYQLPITIHSNENVAIWFKFIKTIWIYSQKNQGYIIAVGTAVVYNVPLAGISVYLFYYYCLLYLFLGRSYEHISHSCGHFF